MWPSTPTPARVPRRPRRRPRRRLRDGPSRPCRRPGRRRSPPGSPRSQRSAHGARRRPPAARVAAAHPGARAGHRRPGPRQVAGAPRRRHRLRHPRRRDPARVRPAHGLHHGAPHPRPPRAGRGTRGRGVCGGDRSRGGVHGDVGPRRDQPRHAARGRLHGLDADRRHHRPGVEQGHRDRRLPGGRHPGHHHAHHEAQLPRHRRVGDPASARRGVPRGRDRPPRSGARRHQQGRPAGQHLLLAGRPRSTCRATVR